MLYCIHKGRYITNVDIMIILLYELEIIYILTQLCSLYNFEGLFTVGTLFIFNFYFLGVDDRVKADKRKSGDLSDDEVIKKKQKKVNVDNLKNKDVNLEKKSLPHKGIQFFFPEIRFERTLWLILS